MGGQDPHIKELVVEDKTNGEGQGVFTSTNEQGTIHNLIMVNETCQQQHVIIDQPV